MNRMPFSPLWMVFLLIIGLCTSLALSQGAPKPPAKGDPVERPTLTPSSNPDAAPRVPTQVGAKKPVQAPLPPGLVRPGLPSQPAVPTRAQVIVAEPPTIELGEFSTSETKPGTVVLRNTSDSPVTIRSAKASCGCTTADFKRNTVLGPGEETEVTIRMRGGPAAKVLNKTVTFTIDGYPQLKVPIKGRSILYVEMKPGIVGSQLNPDGKIVFESIDGQPFKITTVSPPVIDGLSTEKKVRHEATINWEKFMDVAQNARLTIFYDHPLCDQFYTIVKLTPEERKTINDRIREARSKGQIPGKGPVLAADQLPPVARNLDIVSLVANGDVAGVKARIDAGDKAEAVDRQGQSLLAIAAKKGNVNMMRVLLDGGADINGRDRVARTPLMHAGTSRNPEAIRFLMDRGADVNARDSFIGGPLAWTAGFGSSESVQDLLDAGAQVETVGGATGYTPLIWAAGFGDAASVPMLLEAGANIEAKGSIEGNTALMHASKTGKAPAVKALLAKGASLTAKNNMGQTPLLVSASHPSGNVEKILLLLEAGADINAIDNNGRSVLDLAQNRTDAGAGPVILLLQERLGVKSE